MLADLEKGGSTSIPGGHYFTGYRTLRVVLIGCGNAPFSKISRQQRLFFHRSFRLAEFGVVEFYRGGSHSLVEIALVEFGVMGSHRGGSHSLVGVALVELDVVESRRGWGVQQRPQEQKPQSAQQQQTLLQLQTTAKRQRYQSGSPSTGSSVIKSGSPRCTGTQHVSGDPTQSLPTQPVC